MQFAKFMDDGANAGSKGSINEKWLQGLYLADVIVIGLSCSGKTSISFELAEREHYAANLAVDHFKLNPEVTQILEKIIRHKEKPLVVFLRYDDENRKKYVEEIYKRRCEEKGRWDTAYQAAHEVSYRSPRGRRFAIPEIENEIIDADKFLTNLGCVSIAVKEQSIAGIADEVVALMKAPRRPVVEKDSQFSPVKYRQQIEKNEGPES